MKKVFAFFMPCLLVVSTMGIAINKHYCGGKLAGVSLYVAATCGCNSAMSAKCCSQEQEFYQLDEDYSLVAFDYPFETDQVAVVVTYLKTAATDPDHPIAADYLNYKPPLIKRNIPVLVQSFLI